MKKTFPKLYKKTAKGGTQEWEIWVVKLATNGCGKMVTRYGLQDGQKQEIAEIIETGKNVGKKNETTAYQQACAEAESRWNKQKDRKGYGLTVEKSAAVRSVSPMLAHVYEKHKKKVDWGSAFAQPKLDGFRCLAHVTADGDVRLLSRENQPLTALDDLATVIRWMAKNSTIHGADTDHIALDGELYCHGMSLNQISSACKKRSDLTDRIEYHIYDCMIGSADFATRSTFVKDFVEATGHERIRGVKTVKVRSEADLMQCQSEFMEEGYEGAMLRFGRGPYEAGKRSSTLLKVKKWLDDEFVVVDSKLGRGKYAGAAVFTCVTAAGNYFDVLAPGTVEEKKQFGENRKSYVGQRLTVRYQYMTKTDEPVPFLPVAHCFRD